MSRMEEDMDIHIVGAELPEGPALVLQKENINIAISDLYEGKILLPTDKPYFSRVGHEIVIECRDISPEHLSWGWSFLSLGNFPGLEAVIYGGFNYGKMVPILKFNQMDINAIERTKDSFKFRAIAERVCCNLRGA